jgi:hypothetical protein
MQQQPPSFGLNSSSLNPIMNAAAATLFWSQFGRPQPDDKSSKHASFGLNSASLIPAMNAAAATLFGLDSGGLIPTADGLKTASFGLNSGGLTPIMNAAAITRLHCQGYKTVGNFCHRAV